MLKKVLLSAGIVAFLAAGCISLPFVEEKKPTVKLTEAEYDRLLDEKAALEREVAEMVARSEYDALLDEKAALHEKLKASREQIAVLQEERVGERIILLFDGKIKYSVEAAAAMDYEELLVLTMLNDPEFKEAMDMGGREADIALIGLLRKITPADRRVTREEVHAYLKSMKE